MFDENLKTIMWELYEIIYTYDKISTMGIIYYEKDSDRVLFEYFIKDNCWVEKMNGNKNLIEKCIEKKEDIIINDYIDSSMILEADRRQSVYYCPISLDKEVVGIFFWRVEKKVFLKEKF